MHVLIQTADGCACCVQWRRAYRILCPTDQDGNCEWVPDGEPELRQASCGEEHGPESEFISTESCRGTLYGAIHEGCPPETPDMDEELLPEIPGSACEECCQCKQWRQYWVLNCPDEEYDCAWSPDGQPFIDNCDYSLLENTFINHPSGCSGWLLGARYFGAAPPEVPDLDVSHLPELTESLCGDCCSSSSTSSSSSSLSSSSSSESSSSSCSKKQKRSVWFWRCDTSEWEHVLDQEYDFVVRPSAACRFLGNNFVLNHCAYECWTDPYCADESPPEHIGPPESAYECFCVQSSSSSYSSSSFSSLSSSSQSSSSKSSSSSSSFSSSSSSSCTTTGRWRIVTLSYRVKNSPACFHLNNLVKDSVCRTGTPEGCAIAGVTGNITTSGLQCPCVGAVRVWGSSWFTYVRTDVMTQCMRRVVFDFEDCGVGLPDGEVTIILEPC